VDEQLHDVAEQREGLVRGLADREHARQDARNRHDGSADFASDRVAEEDQQVEALVREHRERVGGVDRQRRERGEDVAVEAGRELGALGFRQLFA